MADNTKQQVDQSFFVFVKDTNTGKIKRIAIPGDVQIGLQGNPSELQLLGRLSVATTNYSADAVNKGILYVNNNDTIVSVDVAVTPSSGRVTLYLPSNPRNGQLHFIKDLSGTANVVPIDITPSPGVLIDQFSFQSVTEQYGSVALYWFGDRWRILVAGVGSTSSGAALDATYVTLSSHASLTNERFLNLTGSNVSLVDNGPNASLVLDLTNTTVVPGSYAAANLTVDAKGRITSIANGSTGASISASYITISSEPGLTNERTLAAGPGISIVDGGPNSNVTISSTVVGGADVSASYITIGNTGSLPNERRLAVGTALSLVDAGAGGSVTLDLSAFSKFQLTQIPDVSASYITIGNTGSLPNERRLAVGSSLSLVDGGANGAVTLDLSVLNIFKLTQIPDVSASYIVIGVTGSLPNERALAAGPGITLTDGGAGGTITITNTGTPGSGADVSASYVTIGNTGSLPNERALAVGTGLTLVDGGAGAGVTLDLTAFNKFQLTQIADVSASYITIGNTGSLPNERRLIAGTGISFADSGPGGTLQITNIGALDAADVSASYITIGNTGSLPNERRLAAGAGISLTDGGAGSTITITNTLSANAGADVSASYVVIGNTGSLPNERALIAGTGISLSDGGAGAGITISATGGGSGEVNASYVVLGLTSSLANERVLTAGSGITITDNGPNSTVVIASLTQAAIPVYAMHILAGTATTNVAYFGNKLSLGATYYNTATLGQLPGSKRVYWRGIVDVNSTELNMSASVELYDVNGIVAYPPGVISSSIFSSSAATSTFFSVDLTTALSSVTSSGVFEARLWRTVSGSLASSAACRNARLEVEAVFPATPLFALPALAGVVVTNTAISGSKQALGSLYFNRTQINSFPGTQTFWYRAIVDVLSTELNMSASVDLYDLNGIVAFPPGIIQNSTMSSSSPTSTQIQVNLTSVLSSVTGSGIFEARLWRTISGSLSSSVTCRNARLEVEYS